MGNPKKNFLISGLPGIGKTTLVKKLIARLSAYDPEGFTQKRYSRTERGKAFTWRVSTGSVSCSLTSSTTAPTK